MGHFQKGLSFIIKYFYEFISIVLILTIFICIFFISFNSSIKDIDFTETGELLWPSPGYNGINSYFGKRNAPTSGASTFHKGIDIAAPQGSEYVAVTNGTITFAGFLGGGGYTVTLTDENKINGEIKYSYCHSDPNFIVSVGQKVVKGQVIGKIGPKNVYGVEGNKYFDSNGNPTNGATTGPHLHFGMRIDGEYVNPLNYLRNKQLQKVCRNL